MTTSPYSKLDAAPTYGTPTTGVVASANYPDLTTGHPLYDDDKNPALQGKFVVRGYKDVWAGALFLAHVVGVVVWAIVNLAQKKVVFDSNDGSYSGSSGSDAKHVMMYVPLSAGIAAVTSALALMAMKMHPRAYIIAANIINILLLIGIAVLGFVFINVVCGVMMSIVALIMCVWFYFARDRIPFAGVLLSNSVRVVTRHHGTIVTSFSSLIVWFVFGLALVIMVLPAMANVVDGSSNSNSVGYYYTSSGAVQYHNRNGSSLDGGQVAAICFFLFSIFWSSQVVANVVHVTSAGTVATWFFVGEQAMPHNPTVASFKRATTTSFGSICFGSLLVAIIKFLHTMARSSSGRGSFIGCILICLVSLLERLLEYFNTYAFVHVAIYGSSYLQAAKQTFELAKKCLLNALFNDSLVYPVLALTSLFLSLAIGAVLGAIADSIVIGVITFFVAYVVHVLTLRVVYSAVVTIFVCVAENMDALLVSNPELHQAITAAQAERQAKIAARQARRNGGQPQTRV